VSGDIVERLRQSDGFETAIASDGHPFIRANVGLMRDAADEIERLRNELERVLRIEGIEDLLADLERGESS
jgi:hypothetical protein